MNFNFKKIAEIGLKVIAAIAGGIAIFTGIGKIVKCIKSAKEDKPAENSSNINEKPNFNTNHAENTQIQINNNPAEDNKIVKNIQKGQIILVSLLSVVEGLSNISKSISRLFDPNNYKSSNIIEGYPNYSYNNGYGNQTYNNNIPYGTPVFRGTNDGNQNVYWVRRSNNVIEVW